MTMELFKKNQCGALENTSGDMHMLSDLQLVYMVPRNSTQLLNINTTKFQVEREPVYTIVTVHLTKDLHFAKSAVSSFLRNIVDDSSE